MTGGDRWPVFPLATAIVPGATRLLHVFEPRYLQMFDELGGVGAQFGQVAIERGSEVGGGDARVDVGSAVQVTELRRAPDERLHVAVVGIHRLRVTGWLPDAPYPQATAEVVVDRPARTGDEAIEREACARVDRACRDAGIDPDRLWRAWTGSAAQPTATAAGSRDWSWSALATLDANVLDVVRALRCDHRSERAVIVAEVVEHLAEVRRALS